MSSGDSAGLLPSTVDSPRDDFHTELDRRARRPLVSVIVPTYNRAAFLADTLGSVFRQSVEVHEVLLVDDGSTDDTERVVRDLLASHALWRGRLRYVRQANQGKSAALNAGLKLATGDWIAFNDSDDRWLPEKLELQFKALEQFRTAAACFTDARYVNNPRETQTVFELALPDRTSPFGIKHDVASLYSVSSPGIYMQTMLVQRDVMRACGEFDTSMRMAMDTDFSFRLALITPMCYVNLPLVEVDRTEPRTIGLTTEFPLNGVDRLHAHERMVTKWIAMTSASHPGLRGQLKNRLSRAQSALANQYLLRSDFATARSILTRAAQQNPRAWLLAKLAWCMVSARSLRNEIVRRTGA